MGDVGRTTGNRTTGKRMRFGVFSFSIGPFERLVDRWRRFEALGFGDAWIGDDILVRGYAEFESWTLLGALARETRRLRIGTLISTVRLRHPAFLAAQVLGLDELSGGRAALGLGAGEPGQNEMLESSPPWSAKEVLERLDEQAAILGVLLRGEPLEHPGPYYPTRVSEPPHPVTRPRPPLIVAAHGRIGIRAAARHADAWNCLGGQPYGYGPNPADRDGGRSMAEAIAETRRLLERVDEACEEVGRDPATLDRTILAYRPDPDPFSSADAFEEYVGGYEEIGIGAITFYWPPIDEQLENRMPGPEVEARFEQIIEERIGRRS
jgi:alkanesulfonate monooxygenase SsuD/methylene tetrahydromethanopterin reductase-like flavin-dependent oxidoreductase (luciferase family)